MALKIRLSLSTEEVYQIQFIYSSSYSLIQNWDFEFLASCIVRKAPLNVDNPDFTIQYGCPLYQR